MIEFFKKSKNKTYRNTLSDEDLSRFLGELISYDLIDNLQNDIAYLHGSIETLANAERASESLRKLVDICHLVNGLHSWTINKEEVTDEIQNNK